MGAILLNNWEKMLAIYKNLTTMLKIYVKYIYCSLIYYLNILVNGEIYYELTTVIFFEWRKVRLTTI